MSAFYLVWNKVADDEWQAGGSGRLYSIVSSSDGGQPSFKLERRVGDVIEPLGDFLSLGAAEDMAQSCFAENG